MENGKPKVLTTKGACEYLGVSRWYFETRLKEKLTRLPKIGTRNFFLYEEVVNLKKESGAILNSKYNVIA